MKKKFSIVLPIYKNEENLPITIPYIISSFTLFPTYEVELVMVCDGSPDNSYQIMKEYKQKFPEKIKIARLVHNCGQRAAINCGMRIAEGDVIGVISADLQDPFELFVEMLKYWEEGELLVIGCREDRKEVGIGATCSKLLHKFVNRTINSNYPPGGFDFFLVDQTIAKAFIKADTKNNSMQLLLLDLVGNAKKIGYVRKKRELGSSGWSFARKFDQVFNIITIYSDKPFRFMGLVGLIESIIGFVMILVSIGHMLLNNSNAMYFEILGIGILIMGVVFLVGFTLGIYGFKWMENTKMNPRYIVAEDDDIKTEND